MASEKRKLNRNHWKGDNCRDSYNCDMSRKNNVDFWAPRVSEFSAIDFEYIELVSFSSNVK